MNITEPTDLPVDDESSVWYVSSLNGISQKLTLLKNTAKFDASMHFLTKIEQQYKNSFLDFTHNSASPSKIASLSLYLSLVEQYENTGAICHIRELSERMNFDSSLKDFDKNIVEDFEQKIALTTVVDFIEQY